MAFQGAIPRVLSHATKSNWSSTKCLKNCHTWEEQIGAMRKKVEVTMINALNGILERLKIEMRENFQTLRKYLERFIIWRRCQLCKKSIFSGCEKISLKMIKVDDWQWIENLCKFFPQPLQAIFSHSEENFSIPK